MVYSSSCFYLFGSLSPLSLSLSFSLSRQEYLQLPLKILPSPHSTMSEACVLSLAHLPEILLEEEQETYATSQRSEGHYIIITSLQLHHCNYIMVMLRYCENDLLTKIHNGAGMLCVQGFILSFTFLPSPPLPSLSLYPETEPHTAGGVWSNDPLSGRRTAEDTSLT